MNTNEDEKRQIPEDARTPLRTEILKNNHRMSPAFQKGAGIVLLVLAAIAIIIFIASLSLPGQALHSMKTGVIEEFMQSMQFTSSSKAGYQVERLRERLEELKAIDKNDRPSEDAIRALTALTTQHSEVLAGIINESIDSAFPKSDVLFTLNEFASIAAAMESVAESNPALASLGDHLEDIRRDTVNIYEDRALSFTETETPATVYEFIQARLQEVKEELGDTALSESTIDDAENYLERVGPALAKNDLARAITALAESYRFIKIEKLGGVIESPEQTATSTQATSTEQATTSTSSDSAATTSPFGL